MDDQRCGEEGDVGVEEGGRRHGWGSGWSEDEKEGEMVVRKLDRLVSGFFVKSEDGVACCQRGMVMLLFTWDRRASKWPASERDMPRWLARGV